jgi:SAM-dependent methyltransferase
MKETTKATNRRAKETKNKTFDWPKIFAGACLDVGSGDDPLPFANALDLPDGGGDDVTQFVNGEFDVVHGSNVLEHAIHPDIMLRSWLKILKPQGYVVATVPDFCLYEQLHWPSAFNAGHRSTWSLWLSGSPAITHCLLPEWFRIFPVNILRCELIDTNYNYKFLNSQYMVDQTFLADAGVEACIEFVLQKQ